MFVILRSRFYEDPEVNKCFGYENKYFDIAETYEDALNKFIRPGKTPYARFVFIDDQDDLYGPVRDEYQIIEEEIDLPF